MPPPPGASLRAAARAAFFTLAALALPAALLGTAAYFSSAPAFLAQLSPFRVQAAVCLAALVLLALALRRLRWAALFALFAAVNVWAVLRGPAAPPAAPADHGPAPARLRILYCNVLSSNPDPAPLLALIAAERPDLVALLEVNARWQALLTPALAADFPHHFARPREDNFGLAVFSRAPLSGERVKFFADLESPSLDFLLPHPAGDIRALLTHPLPPGSTRTAALRDRHLAELADWHRSATSATPATSAPPVLILGDFNATPWCPPLRRLLAVTGLRPAARDHGPLPRATWPAAVPFLRVPLDHALLSPRLACPHFRVGPEIGSDHLPLILELLPIPSP